MSESPAVESPAGARTEAELLQKERARSRDNLRKLMTLNKEKAALATVQEELAKQLEAMAAEKAMVEDELVQEREAHALAAAQANAAQTNAGECGALTLELEALAAEKARVEDELELATAQIDALASSISLQARVCV